MCSRSVLYDYGSLTIALVGLLVAGCGDSSPTKPSRPTPSQFAGIEVTGPDSVFGGQSAQFVANIRQADGTTKSATSMPGLRWRSSNPWVMSVSNTGVVTASGPGSGEAVITADIPASGSAQGTRTVLFRPAVTAALDVTKQETAGQISYAFALTLTESASVPTTITAIWVTFDSGWGAQCSWTSNQLRQSRLPANGTLVLDPLICDDFHEEASSVDVSIELTDDKGHRTQIYQWREPVVG
jgi:hypothetical protein